MINEKKIVGIYKSDGPLFTTNHFIKLLIMANC